MSTITSKYRTINTTSFIDDFDDDSFYLFASSVDDQVINNDSEYAKRYLLENTIFGKRITQNEVFNAIRIYQWQSGTVYVQYDDREQLANRPFYVVVYPQGEQESDYRIFKCLFNYTIKTFTKQDFE